jgi:molecular chaperone DnaK (HSP70)
MNEIIIGIDLGTTNSEVAIIENGQVLVIADNNRKIFPSFVGIDDQGDIFLFIISGYNDDSVIQNPFGFYWVSLQNEPFRQIRPFF